MVQGRWRTGQPGAEAGPRSFHMETEPSPLTPPSSTDICLHEDTAPGQGDRATGWTQSRAGGTVPQQGLGGRRDRAGGHGPELRSPQPEVKDRAPSLRVPP